jgi:hypothetical protein
MQTKFIKEKWQTMKRKIVDYETKTKTKTKK